MYILDTYDPYKRRVVLKENTWHEHITKRHPEVIGYLKDIKNTIENPDNIIPHREIATREIYLKEVNTLSTNMVVYVEHLETPSVIVSAHFARKDTWSEKK